MSVPEGVQTVEAEGRDLKTAVAAAMEKLELPREKVKFEIDMSHFRSTTGVSVSRSTVKIIAWEVPGGEEASEEAEAKPKPKPRSKAKPKSKARARAEEEEAEAPAEVEAEAEATEPDEKPAKPKRKRKRKPAAEVEAAEAEAEAEAPDEVEAEAEAKPRKSRKTRRTRSKKEEPENGEASKPEQLRGAEDDQTEASRFAQAWFEKLLEFMDVEGKVSGSGNAERVHLAIDAERAGRIVGKRGATLGAIRHLLGLALEKRFGDLTVDVDVGDDRREERKPRRERSRGRDRGRPRGRERARGRFPEEKLQALARRGAEKAIETGRTYTINLELNAYDRRVIHMEISEIDGVDSQSEEREDGGRALKYIQIIPD